MQEVVRKNAINVRFRTLIKSHIKHNTLIPNQLQCLAYTLQYQVKINMKKTTLILAILLISVLGFLSKKVESKVNETSIEEVVEEVVQEDELILEDWMITPFRIK
jgi:hypothetical protein